MAVGDAWVLNDPIVGQGANLGSRAAFVLGAAIAAGGPFDEDFCSRTAEAMWAVAQAPCAVTNAFLAPPAPHVVEVLLRAATDRTLADRIVEGFADPSDLLRLFSPAVAAV
jgi:2-polyprenyl-6-methoxyphenol hydroxylase-like FAD-dependent oxidoreductase